MTKPITRQGKSIELRIGSCQKNELILLVRKIRAAKIIRKAPVIKILFHPEKR